MNIDKRYVELLARVAPRKGDKKASRFGCIGFILLLAGGIIYLRGDLYGLAVMAAGLVLCILSAVIGRKYQKAFCKEFMKYYEKNKKLMPWPEGPQNIQQVDK